MDGCLVLWRGIGGALRGTGGIYKDAVEDANEDPEERGVRPAVADFRREIGTGLAYGSRHTQLCHRVE